MNRMLRRPILLGEPAEEHGAEELTDIARREDQADLPG